MPTLVLDPPPVEFQAVLERRRRLSLDHHDEMWQGVLHVAPAPHDAHADVQHRAIERSELVDLGASDLVERIDWPSGE